MGRSCPRPENFTVGWVSALSVERAAAEHLLDEIYDEDIPKPCQGPFVLGRMAGHNVVIGCLSAGFMGTSPAAAIAACMESIFKSIQFYLMVGIGDGVPGREDIRLGDVVVSLPNSGHGGVLQHDLGKVETNGFQRTGFLNAPPRVLLDAITELHVRRLRKTGQCWEHLSAFDQLPDFTRARAGRDALFMADAAHVSGSTCEHCDPSHDRLVHRPQRQDETPVMHYGTIASGNQVMKDAIVRDQRSTEPGDVLCFEMEAAGLMNYFPCLVIRGIHDYCDSHKNDAWQPYASTTASSCAKVVPMLIPSTARASDRPTSWTLVGS